MIPLQLSTAEADLALRPFTSDDADAVYDYWCSDPGWERFNASVPRDFSRADAASFVADLCARDRDTAPNWAILLDRRVVGVVSMNFEHGHRLAVIGYGIHGDCKGKGLTTVAVATVIGEAFRRYPQLARIRAHTDAANGGSMRVLEKLGFVHEGTLRNNQFVKEQLVDEAIFGMLREEWSPTND